MRWQWLTVQGEMVDEGAIAVTVPAGANQKVVVLDVRPQINQFSPRNLLLYLDLIIDGATVSTNLVLLARPKHMELPHPTIERQLESLGEGQYRLTLTADRPALWTWVSLPGHAARFADNFVHLRPRQPFALTFTLPEELPVAQVAEALQVNSLVDTY